MNLDYIFNWKLLKGSHEFPGPDGGTCINEAAIIAAGFEYKKVQSANDCPPCFSRPLSAYLININDRMPDNERQKLMRFVMRLSGSADTPDTEKQRAELITLRTVQRILPISLRASGLHANADECEKAVTVESVARAASAAAGSSWVWCTSWASWVWKTACDKSVASATSAASAAALEAAIAKAEGKP